MRGLIAARGHVISNVIQIDFQPLWPWNWTDDLDKQEITSFKLLAAMCAIPQLPINSNWSWHPEIPISEPNHQLSTPATSQFDRWPRKTNMASLPCRFKFCASFPNHLLSYSPETPKLGHNLCWPLFGPDLWPLNMTFCMDITFVNGNNSRKYHDTMGGTLWKSWQIDRGTDGWTDGKNVPRAALSQLKIVWRTCICCPYPTGSRYV